MARPTVPTTGQTSWASTLNNAIFDVSDRTDAASLTLPKLISATAYTLILADGGLALEFTAATAITVTIPTNSAVAFPIGTTIELLQAGAGAITVGGASVTIRSVTSSKSSGAQWSTLFLRKRGTDEWVLSGETF